MKWDESSDRVQQKILYGNPADEGLYIIRVRFPAGGTSRPHFHSQDRFVTVIEGVWNAGTDASHDMTATTPIPAGGFMLHPAGAVHYDGSRGGPWSSRFAVSVPSQLRASIFSRKGSEIPVLAPAAST